MASAKLLDQLHAAWCIAEGRSRRYERGNMRPLPVTPEHQAIMDRIKDAQRFANQHTDRETAEAFPDVVQRATTLAQWERIKPVDNQVTQ